MRHRFALLPLLLLAFTLVASSAQAQSDGMDRTFTGERKAKLIFQAGTFLAASQDEPNQGAAISLLGFGVQYPINTLFDVRAMVYSGYDANTWRCPIEVWVWSQGEDVSGTLELMRVFGIAQEGRVELEPFLGAGFSYVGGGEADPGRPEVFGIEQTTSPMVTYGLSLIYRATRSVDVMAQVRGATILVGEQALQTFNRQTSTFDVGTANSWSLFVGTSLRLF